MWRLLAGLPRRQRAVLVLGFYEDQSDQQIAALMGCSQGTVRSQRARALANLRANPAFIDHPERHPSSEGETAR